MSDDASPKKVRPYADAPRLPLESEGARVDLRTFVQGAWLEVEIGPGRGGFVFERAVAAPEAALVGFEIRRKWATIVDRRLDAAGHGKRARVFAEDAKFVLPRIVPDQSVRRFFMHFPDPWWKKRHQKRLVMGDVLLDHVRRLLEPGGELFVQTDVEERADQYETMITDHGGFVPFGDAPGSPRLAENPYGARSPREHRAIADGIPIGRLRFRRKD